MNKKNLIRALFLIAIILLLGVFFNYNYQIVVGPSHKLNKLMTIKRSGLFFGNFETVGDELYAGYDRVVLDNTKFTINEEIQIHGKEGELKLHKTGPEFENAQATIVTTEKVISTIAKIAMTIEPNSKLVILGADLLLLRGSLLYDNKKIAADQNQLLRVAAQKLIKLPLSDGLKKKFEKKFDLKIKAKIANKLVKSKPSFNKAKLIEKAKQVKSVKKFDLF